MRLGFLGGSFNPPTNIHTNLAENVREKCKLDKVIFVPVGDYYEKTSLISSKHRYNMLKLATKNKPNLDVDDIASKSQVKLYAIDTFNLILDKYKGNDIFFIMGSDNFRKMPEWKNYDNLINTYNIIVVERERQNIRYQPRKNIIEIIPDKLEIVDSTKIRNMIKENQDVSNFLNKDVYKYIKENNLYL